MFVSSAARGLVSLQALHLLVPLAAQGHFPRGPGPLFALVAHREGPNPGPAPPLARCAMLGLTPAPAFQTARRAKQACIRLRLEGSAVRFALRARILSPRRPAALAVHPASPRVKAERPRAAHAKRGRTRQLGAPSNAPRARVVWHNRLPVRQLAKLAKQASTPLPGLLFAVFVPRVCTHPPLGQLNAFLVPLGCTQIRGSRCASSVVLGHIRLLLKAFARHALPGDTRVRVRLPVKTAARDPTRPPQGLRAVFSARSVRIQWHLGRPVVSRAVPACTPVVPRLPAALGVQWGRIGPARVVLPVFCVAPADTPRRRGLSAASAVESALLHFRARPLASRRLARFNTEYGLPRNLARKQGRKQDKASKPGRIRHKERAPAAHYFH